MGLMMVDESVAGTSVLLQDNDFYYIFLEFPTQVEVLGRSSTKAVHNVDS
jgi:hypothetical protein